MLCRTAKRLKAKAKAKAKALMKTYLLRKAESATKDSNASAPSKTSAPAPTKTSASIPTNNASLTESDPSLTQPKKNKSTITHNDAMSEEIDSPRNKGRTPGEILRTWEERQAASYMGGWIPGGDDPGDGGDPENGYGDSTGMWNGGQTEPEDIRLLLSPQSLGTSLDSVSSHCRRLYAIISRQISQPESPSTYLNRVIEASKSISEGPHKITPKERLVFAMLYQAMFDNYAANDEFSAASHLTAAKTIAKSLGLESEIEMNRPFGPEPHLYALSVRSISRRVISQFLQDIRKVLLNNKHADSFGSLFNVGISTNTKVMCCVFGSRTPGKFIAPKRLICENTSEAVFVLVIKDSINEAATSKFPPSSWINRPIRDAESIDLSGHSVGQEGDMEEAGSFGFYADINEEKIFGFTAAHCTPRADEGTVIVSPSTRELTGRLESAVRYTSFAPNPIQIRARREAEVESLLRNWVKVDSDEGCLIRERVELDEGYQIQERKVKLIGQKFGTVKGKSTTYKSGVLEEHNRRLEKQHATSFDLLENKDGLGEEESGRFSRIEWCCFEVLGNRFGENRLDSDADTAVRGIGLLEPDMVVSKIGRTTGETEGSVNGCVIQRWADSVVTIEIGVLGDGEAFADVGDSGSLVVTQNNGELYGVGMLIGKNSECSLGLISPLWAILEDAEAVLEQRITFHIE